MYSVSHLTWSAVVALLFSPGASASSICDAACQQRRSSGLLGSLAKSIEGSISNAGNLDILRGGRVADWPGFHDTSATLNQLAKALEAYYPSRVSHVSESDSEDADGRICIDIALLAKLTAAASSCHSQPPSPFDHPSSSSSSSSINVNPSREGNDVAPHDDTINPGSHGSQIIIGGGESDSTDTTADDDQYTDSYGSDPSGSTSTDSEGTTLTSGWGHDHADDEAVCFRIKDKRTDRYLSSGNSEYAFAYHANSYSIFRALPAKGVENGYTMTEINRSGRTTNYPVKVNTALGQFKPSHGHDDAVFTFSPANFGDSCWGVPGMKMSRRHDWGVWGDNYRAASSGDDCADVVLEEADC